jgi:hypothetical protein
VIVYFTDRRTHRGVGSPFNKARRAPLVSGRDHAFDPRVATVEPTNRYDGLPEASIRGMYELRPGRS